MSVYTTSYKREFRRILRMLTSAFGQNRVLSVQVENGMQNMTFRGDAWESWASDGTRTFTIKTAISAVEIGRLKKARKARKGGKV